MNAPILQYRCGLCRACEDWFADFMNSFLSRLFSSWESPVCVLTAFHRVWWRASWAQLWLVLSSASSAVSPSSSSAPLDPSSSLKNFCLNSASEQRILQRADCSVNPMNTADTLFNVNRTPRHDSRHDLSSTLVRVKRFVLKCTSCGADQGLHTSRFSSFSYLQA